MYPIIDNTLYLGTEKYANGSVVLSPHIAIVNCTKDLPFVSDRNPCFRVPVKDSCQDKDNEEMYSLLDAATKFIDDHIHAGRMVLVHCRQAIQRSPAVIAAYLIKYNDMSLSEAKAFIKNKRPKAFFTEANFDKCLKKWEASCK